MAVRYSHYRVSAGERALEARVALVQAASDPWATVVLVHGAGGDRSSPLMRSFAQGLAALGLAAVTFDFGYRAVRRGPRSGRGV